MPRLALLLVLSLAGCGVTLRSPAHLADVEVASLEAFDLTDWANVLSEHVDGQGRVDYVTLRAQRDPLDRFVALLARVGPTTRPELFRAPAQRLAYYLNAYNALVIFQVLERWPLTSVEDDLLTFFFWTRFALDGAELSLHALENEVIRPGFSEPRVHFALNCASAGCPRLPAAPFLAERLEEQLNGETSRFLSESRNVALEDGAVMLSQIFEWYAEDFRPSPLEWIRAQAPDLELPAGADVRHVPYDWSLNSQERP